MAKRKREITQAKIERFLKEGRGQGNGKDYLSWLSVQDVPSQGSATRGIGWTTDRRHELFPISNVIIATFRIIQKGYQIFESNFHSFHLKKH